MEYFSGAVAGGRGGTFAGLSRLSGFSERECQIAAETGRLGDVVRCAMLVRSRSSRGGSVSAAGPGPTAQGSRPGCRVAGGGVAVGPGGRVTTHPATAMPMARV
jgi:hypothetical protein